MPEGFDITGLSEARSVERFQALHPEMQENIKKLPLVAKHGLAPEAVFATMRHDAADRFGGDLGTAYTRYMMNAMGLKGPAVVRKKLPTNPGLPSVPKLDIPTAATNAGVRGVG